MWSNLFRVDWNDGSVLKADKADLEMIRAAQRGVLRDEIAILEPRAVVFFTGPNYDFELKDEFGGVDFQALGNVPVRRLARLAHPALPQKTFRTYHPGFLKRSKQWHFIRLIASLITSPKTATLNLTSVVASQTVRSAN
jgi:hypothetical protein